MRIEKIRHENVNPNGTFSDGTKGAVVTTGRIMMGYDHGEYWLSICAKRTPEGVVEGMTVYFSSLKEREKFFTNEVLVG